MSAGRIILKKIEASSEERVNLKYKKKILGKDHCEDFWMDLKKRFWLRKRRKRASTKMEREKGIWFFCQEP